MNVLDRTFRVSLVSPNQIGAIARLLTQHELVEDPNDFIATHLLHLTSNLTVSASIFGAVYLLLHGLVKIVLVQAGQSRATASASTRPWSKRRRTGGRASTL